MRRLLTICAMLGVLVSAHLLNAWSAQVLQEAQGLFSPRDKVWLFALLPLLASAGATGLGWLVLGARRPDPLVAVAYVVAGLAVVSATPLWVGGAWAPPAWLPIHELLTGQALAVWEGAAIAVIGFVELARWFRRPTTDSDRPAQLREEDPADDAAVAQRSRT